ncbi:MAG: YidH family protein [Gemmatimonas sp.]
MADSDDSVDRRTRLAADRTVYAAERTYAAWVRTGLAALASGVGAKPLLADIAPGWALWTAATVLLVFSAFAFIAGVWRELTPGYLRPRPDARRLPPWLLIVVNGSLAVIAVTALIGLWAGAD